MMNICMIANGHDYVIELAILIVSILQNSDEEDNFYFHIITEYMDELDKNKLIAGGFTGDLDFKIAMKTNDVNKTPSVTKIYIEYK